MAKSGHIEMNDFHVTKGHDYLQVFGELQRLTEATQIDLHMQKQCKPCYTEN